MEEKKKNGKVLYMVIMFLIIICIFWAIKLLINQILPTPTTYEIVGRSVDMGELEKKKDIK